MRRNATATTIIVTCDTPGCGTCWLHDGRPATYPEARTAATERARWKFTRTDTESSDTCRYCVERAAGAAAA